MTDNDFVDRLRQEGQPMNVHDTVIELRKIHHQDKVVERIIRSAASEIVRLREEIGMLLAQRDEARREVCNMKDFHGLPRDYALERGWDCFEETIR